MALTLKDRIRADRVAARGEVPEVVRRAETRALIYHARQLVGPAYSVAAYVPLSSEPGFPNLADALATEAKSVLLPVARESADGIPLALQWALYRPGDLVEAPYGLSEPPPPWLPPTALAAAHVVFVPALAVDRRGVRLGRGAGFYDRSLRYRNSAARVIAA